MNLRAKNKLIKLINSSEFQEFILLTGEPLKTSEVVDWLIALHPEDSGIPFKLKEEVEEIESIGIDNNFIIEDNEWIDIKFSQYELNESKEIQTHMRIRKQLVWQL